MRDLRAAEAVKRAEEDMSAPTKSPRDTNRTEQGVKQMQRDVAKRRKKVERAPVMLYIIYSASYDDPDARLPKVCPTVPVLLLGR